MSTMAEIRAALERHHKSGGWEPSCHLCLEPWPCAARALLATLPADGVIVTPNSLDRLMVRVCTDHGWTVWAPRDPFISAILAALAAEGGPA
jgi:hypothetical protein